MRIVVAFLAGIATFFTPCVFPLIPSYISYVTGFSIDELSKGDKKLVLKRSVTGTFLFILGFTIVFVLMGFTASFAGNLILAFQNYLRVIGGILIVFFGLMMTGVLDIKFLEIEKRFHLKEKPIGHFGALLLGMTFAAGWMPCVGPILSSILIIAATTGSRFYGGILLFAYCIGLGIPILISAIAFNYFLTVFKGTVRYIRTISIISGIILIAIGILLIIDSLVLLSNLFYYFPGFKGLL